MMYLYNVENLKVLKCLPIKNDEDTEFEITGKCNYANNDLKDNEFRINISPVDANKLKNQINKHIDNEWQDETNDQSDEQLDDQLEEIIDENSYIDINRFTSFVTESDNCVMISCGVSPRPIRIDKDFLINLVQGMSFENDN